MTISTPGNGRNQMGLEQVADGIAPVLSTPELAHVLLASDIGEEEEVVAHGENVELSRSAEEDDLASFGHRKLDLAEAGLLVGMDHVANFTPENEPIFRIAA